MTDPLFTVLCATYEQAEYLPDMLASVEAQTYGDYELVVVDDGSTDATPAVLTAWYQRAPTDLQRRTSLLRTANGGQSAAYERGLAVSRGRWICLLDSDDRFAPEKLARLANAVRNDPAVGMIMHPLRVVDQSGRPTGVLRPQGAALSNGDLRAQMRRNARHSAPGASGLVLRRDVMELMFPAPTKRFRFAADAYLSFGAACLAPITALQEPLADYRMQPGGQYLIRMLSASGLRQQVEFQRVVADHFDVLDAITRNSYFARNQYAAVSLDADGGTRVPAFVALVRATITDPYFRPGQKAALAVFWALTFVAGRRHFQRAWDWFQYRQTGWDKVGRLRLGALQAGATGQSTRPAVSTRFFGLLRRASRSSTPTAASPPPRTGPV